MSFLIIRRYTNQMYFLLYMLQWNNSYITSCWFLKLIYLLI